MSFTSPRDVGETLYVSSGRGRSLYVLNCVPLREELRLRGAPRAGVSNGSKIRLRRLIFFEATDTHDAEADDVTLRVHPLHNGIILRLTHVSRRIREDYYEEVAFRV